MHRAIFRFLCGYNVFLEFILLGVLIIFSQTGCPTDRIYGEVELKARFLELVRIPNLF